MQKPMKATIQELLAALSEDDFINKLLELGVQHYEWEDPRQCFEHGWYVVSHDGFPGIIHFNHSIIERLDGPAVYYKNLNKSRYWIENNCLNEKEYWEHPKVIEHKLNTILSY